MSLVPAGVAVPLPRYVACVVPQYPRALQHRRANYPAHEHSRSRSRMCGVWRVCGNTETGDILWHSHHRPATATSLMHPRGSKAHGLEALGLCSADARVGGIVEAPELAAVQRRAWGEKCLATDTGPIRVSCSRPATVSLSRSLRARATDRAVPLSKGGYGDPQRPVFVLARLTRSR